MLSNLYTGAIITCASRTRLDDRTIMIRKLPLGFQTLTVSPVLFQGIFFFLLLDYTSNFTNRKPPLMQLFDAKGHKKSIREKALDILLLRLVQV